MNEYTIKHHVVCGLHSNIPPCCIAWFSTGWKVVYSKPYYRDLYHVVSKHSAGMWPGYIPCPMCIVRRRKPNKTRKCGCYEGNKGTVCPVREK